VDAFDADVLIYAAVPGHRLGGKVAALLDETPDTTADVGSVLLLPEVLAKPLREGRDDEAAVLARETCDRRTRARRIRAR
jgi:hypothetical protein